MFSIEGIIVKGMGEGKMFMSMPHYKNEIKKKLGFEAYPGTLNIKTKFNTKMLVKTKPILLEGFSSGEKVFGGAKCYSSSIYNINGAIIVPDFTKHEKDIVEFIAPVHIKTELNLNNGDKIKIDVQ